MNYPTVEAEIAHRYGLGVVECEFLDTPTNDLVVVHTTDDRFALKIYNVKSRTAVDVQWEVDLITHLIDGGAPVAHPVMSRQGRHVEMFTIDGIDRVGVLFEWAPGTKPEPSLDMYALLGEAAARVHCAADSFTSSLPRERYDADVLIDEQLTLMQAHLVAAERWDDVVRLGDRLKQGIADPLLDRGVCHMDLTLDNVHVFDMQMTVFDFDSAGACWRALEPHGVLRNSRDYLQAWLEGYRSVRKFSVVDEQAVHAFAVIGNLRVVAWDLGVARSSRGAPLLHVADLDGVVDEWLAWADGNE